MFHENRSTATRERNKDRQEICETITNKHILNLIEKYKEK